MTCFSHFPQRLFGAGLLGAALLTTAGAKTLETPQYQIMELLSNSQKFTGRKLVVSGTLELASGDYFSAPRFVLADGAGNSIPVTAWAPLEVPPTSVARTGEVPLTMRDFVGQRLSVTGDYRPYAGSSTPLFVADSASGWLPQSAPTPFTEAPDAAPGPSSSRLLVLMVDFPDKPGQVSGDFFQDLIFGNRPGIAPNGSVKDYYREVSYGKWDITGSVNRPGVAWLRLPQSSHYYSGDCYGIGRGSECPAPRYPQNPQKMVEDAIVEARRAGIDFSQYDGNNDGLLDSLIVIHAGIGAEFSLDRNDIWSHRGAPQAWINTAASGARPVWVGSYLTIPEYWTSPGDLTIGVIAHEYGHSLGLPDLYDIGNDSAGAGVWSLMASGCWNGKLGDSPAHLDAWGKYTLGWVKPKQVLGTLRNQPIVQAATTPDVYQFIGARADRTANADFYGEYFLIENRELVGFDRALPGPGLLIWHVDNTLFTNMSQWYPGCPDCSGHYRVALVQADRRWDLEHNRNRGDAGDPFRAACGSGTCNSSFTEVSDPNSQLYSGASTGFSVTAISSPGSTMTVTLSDGKPPTSSGIDTLGIRSPGTVALTTSGGSAKQTSGYGRLQAAPDSTTPSGLAIWGWRSDNVLVSEASVPASGLIRSGRIPVNIGSAMDTGVAFANPSDETAVISFFFTDADGRDFGNGTLQLAPHTQIARFFTEAPFAAGRPFKGTCTFESSVPVGTVALRSLVNEHSEFLMTTLPVVGLEPALSNSPAILPHYADGGGWSTQVILVNPTGQVLRGAVEFTASTGTPDVLSYAIAPRSQQLLETPGLGGEVRTGSVWVTPDATTSTPSVAGVISFRAKGVTVSVAGMPAVQSGKAFRLYAESTGNFAAAEAGATQTGLAVTNASETPVTVHFELLGLDGTSVASSVPRVVPQRGHLALFLKEIPEFRTLPNPFRGLVRVWTDFDMPISVTGIRGRYNERHDFLITTLPPTNENDPPSSAERIFPQLIRGGGAATEIILFSPGPQAASGVLHLYSQDGGAVAADLP